MTDLNMLDIALDHGFADARLKADLKIIAKKYNILPGSQETDSQIIEKIVENSTKGSCLL